MAGNFVYPESPSTSIKAYYGVTFLTLFYLFISEVTRNHLNYSKFWSSGSARSCSRRILLPSRAGMLIFYSPALIAGVSAFGLFPNGGIRFLMVKSAVTVHFLKRVLEVLFLHKFSSFIALDTAVIISASYFGSAAGIIYLQHQTLGSPEPCIDLKYLGLLVFLTGILGNFYHHYILSNLRRDKSDKGYKIPTGGLFGLVICPHYLFEILTFLGISFISQTIYSNVCAIGIWISFVSSCKELLHQKVVRFEVREFSESCQCFDPICSVMNIL